MVRVADTVVPILAMIVVQTAYAGMSLISKLAMNGGMKPFVLVTYRQIFAALSTCPFAFIVEREMIPRITIPILFQIYLCSITGTFLNQILFFVGLNYSTPTIACALANVLPAITFIFAAIFRQELVRIKTRAGQAKVVGTAVCVGGAMLLSFYHGHILAVSHWTIHWKYIDNITNTHGAAKKINYVGPICLFLSTVSLGIWFVIQSKLSKQFCAPYTTTTLMCLMASAQSAIVGACVVRDLSEWSLKSGIRIVTTLYAAVVGSAFALSIMSWCIHKKGPLYVAVFNPLSLVITAIFSWALLREKLYLGTLLGAILIILGLYTVLWGKDKEAEQKQLDEAKHTAQELQMNDQSNHGIDL